MSLIGNLAARVGLRERRAGVRVRTHGLDAFLGTSGEQRPAAIKDIGPTGICLMAGDAIPVGSKITLTLRRKVIEEAECGTRILMPARVARTGKHELGLEFVHEHIDAAGWSELVLQAAQLSARNDGVRVFRIARALAFLRRISPSAEKRFLDAMTGGMSYDGEERALEIFLRAEELLSSRNVTPKTGVHAKLIQHMVDRGVNLDTCEADMAQYWAGLLAAATLEGTDDEESLRFGELLSKIDLVPMRILAAGCKKAMAEGWDTGFVFPQRVYYSADEIRRITGLRNVVLIDRGIYRLHELGLLQNGEKAPTFEPVEEVDLTPTGLGLQLHARCMGRLEAPETCMAGGGNLR